MFRFEETCRYTVAVKLRSRQKRWFVGRRHLGEVQPRFQTCIFKSHSLPSIWPDMVEFRSTSSEDS